MTPEAVDGSSLCLNLSSQKRENEGRICQKQSIRIFLADCLCLVSYLTLYSIMFLTCKTFPVPQTRYVDFHTSQSRTK